jgi:hypothetical protein
MAFFREHMVVKGRSRQITGMYKTMKARNKIQKKKGENHVAYENK